MEELTIILKSWRELTTTKYSKKSLEDLEKAIVDGTIDFITLNNELNWNKTIVRTEDISAILYIA